MAPPLEPPPTVTVRVKVPPGSIPGGADEFTLGGDIPVSSRIGQIRERIQQSLPSSPTPDRQRLLYGGRALVDNEQTVGDALNVKRDPSQQEYVIHLLVKGDGASTTPVPGGRGTGTPNRSASPVQPPGNGQLQPQQQVPLHQDHINHHVLQQQLQQQQQQHLQQLRHQAAVYGQQHRLQAEMHINANHNRFIPSAGLMPFGMQPMQFGHPAPVPHPQQGVPGGFPQIPIHQHHHHPAPPHQGLRQSESANEQGQQHMEHSANTQTLGQIQNTMQTQQAVPQHPPRRPPSNQGFHMEGIGPNGERIIVHQQTVNLPHSMLPAPSPTQMPQGPPFTGFPGMPPMIEPSTRQQGLSVLETARANIADTRRRLDRLRNANGATDTNPAVRSIESELDQIEQSMQALGDYIDPQGLAGGGHNQRRTESPRPVVHPYGAYQTPHPQPLALFNNDASWQQRAQATRQQQMNNITSSSDVTCYLLSSPTGPSAILYSPRHGAFHGSFLQQSQAGATGLQPTATTSTATNGNVAQPVPAADGQGQVAAAAAPPAQAQAQAAQQEAMGPLAPVINHLWLLLRILIFSYFLLGANMGWRRPLALIAIGIGFWMMRVGLLAEGAAIRRWWDGVMNDNQRQPQRQQGQGQQQGEGQDQQQQQQQQQQRQQQNGEPRLRAGQMPTPEQVAQRLLNEDAQLRNARFQWIRERVRPIERAVMLLFASLWPGVGEAYVREREQEDRRRAEEEIAAQRREEEERQRKEGEEKEEKQQTDDQPSSKNTTVDASGAAAAEAGTSPNASDKALPSATEGST